MIIANEVDKLAESLRGIRAAITERGGTVSNTAGFKDLPDAVRSIPAGDSWYDFFWDAYQDNGNRTDCSNMFSGRGWTNDTFKPKYDTTVYNAYMLFRYSGIVDLGEALRVSGRKLVIDTNSLAYTFNTTLMEVIDGIEFKKPIERFDSTFSYSNKLREIKVPLPVTETTVFSGAFDGCSALEEMRFDKIRTISTSTLNLKSCTKLSKESFYNVIEALHDNLSGLCVTLSKTAVDNAFETSKGLADGSTSTEWITLISERTMCTILLI